MSYWVLFLIIAVVSLILEMFTPAMFFLSVAISALFTAIASLWNANLLVLGIAWAVLSVLILLLIRPLMKKFMHEMPKSVDFESEYIGVKATEDISATTGAIAIYGERWDARLADETAEIITKDSNVKIVRNDSIILYVEKVSE